MPKVNIDLYIRVFFDLEKKKYSVIYSSPQASENIAWELWSSEKKTDYIIYTTDAYYNEKLKQQRNNDKMRHPKTKEKLTYLGNVLYGNHSIYIGDQNNLQIICHKITLEEVFFDET